MERIAFLTLALLTVPLVDSPGEPGRVFAVPDSIQEQLQAGRFWKASLGLRAFLDPLESAPVGDRLILAEAEAGWKNWPGVVEVLQAGDLDVESAPSRYWYLLGVALQQTGEAGAGQAALRRFLDRTPSDSPTALVARSRLLQASEGPSGDVRSTAEVLESLGALRTASPALADWTAIELAEVLSDQGRPDETARVLDLIVSAEAGRLGWSWVADAWAVAGDTARALEVLEGIDLELPNAPTQGALLGRVWPLRLALGDSVGATASASELLAHETRGSRAVAAAERVVATSVEGTEADVLLAAAGALSSGGVARRALEAWRLAVERGGVLSDRERLARAGALLATGERSAAAQEYGALALSDEPRIAAPALRSLSRIRRREGRAQEARSHEDDLVARFPERDEALSLVYLRGDDLQDAGRFDDAIRTYRQVIDMSSSANQAGLARMRWGHIHLTREEYADAAGVFEAYLEEFPNGRRWDEASYWGAWAALRAGDGELASSMTDRLLSEGPLSYYAVLAAQLGAEPFRVDLPEGPPLPEPAWLAGELEVLELLDEAGLSAGADVQVQALKDAAWDSDDVLLKLAQELNLRGRTMDGINLGWEVRRRGRSWDKTLLRVVYPFPYRDMVMSFARERNLDPYLLAGLIRQESAFVPDIVSRAGAVGLMQVVPATGRELARAVGPRGFHDDALTTPEVNIHLGSRFLVDLMRRYPDMPLVLSAYNAGPTRADRWKNFPEARDPDRFTERIPFAETRGYVKNVTRNRALYRYLYGDGEVGPASR